MRLIIDTDAGVDDALAIIMALRQPGATVEAITSVTGNVRAAQVTANVFTVLDLLGAQIPVYQGAEQPLLPGFWEPEVRKHGEDGLGNYPHRLSDLPAPEAEPAAAALVRLAREHPGVLTLVALGPLTNIALACRLDPAFPRHIGRLVVMGGTIHAMGSTPTVTADFNFYCDPEAALITLDAFPQVTLLPWETALRHPFTWEQYDVLAALDTAAGRFFKAITFTTVNFLRRYREVPGYLLPDQLAMAAALVPDVVTDRQRHYVTVEVGGWRTRGQAVVDAAGLTGRDPNAELVTGLDLAAVYDLFRASLA